jgi:hypothetical protein
MIRRLAFGCFVAIGLMTGAGSAFAFGPVNPSILGEQASLIDVSFFGRPYPYGFTGWGPCIRYVEVETRWGPRLRRVWICR